MKRRISYVIMACILFAMSIMNLKVEKVYAATPVTIEVGSEKANAGGKVTVYVSVKDNPGYAGIQFTVKFDSDSLSIASATEITDSVAIEPIIQTKSDSVTYVAAEAEDYKGNGKILKLEFEVADDAKVGDVKLTLEDVMVVTGDLDILETKNVEGKITVTKEPVESNNDDEQDSENSSNEGTDGSKEDNTKEDNTQTSDDDSDEEAATNNGADDSQNAENEAAGTGKTSSVEKTEKEEGKGSIVVKVIVIVIIGAAVFAVGFVMARKKKQSGK